MAEWFEGLDDETKAHVTTKGWDKPLTPEIATAIVQSHLAAQKFIGVPPDQIVRLPKDTADPNYQKLYDKVVGMGLPADDAAYNFAGVKFADGTALDDDFTAGIRTLAKDLKMPPAAAERIARHFVSIGDAASGEEKSSMDLNTAAGQAALRGKWGASYDTYAFSANRAREAAGLPDAFMGAINMLPPEQYVSSMDALRLLGAKMGEASYLSGDTGRIADPTAGMSADTARARLAQLQSDPEEAGRWIKGDPATQELFKKLTTIIATDRMPPGR